MPDACPEQALHVRSCPQFSQDQQAASTRQAYSRRSTREYTLRKEERIEYSYTGKEDKKNKIL